MARRRAVPWGAQRLSQPKIARKTACGKVTGVRNLLAVAAIALAFVLGAFSIWHFTRLEKPLPDAPALILKVREVARLESLDVSLYKKIDFAPDPKPSDSGCVQFAQWIKEGVSPARGKASVFAIAHLSLDLRTLDVGGVRGPRPDADGGVRHVATRLEPLPA